jgi:hypothetical protein
LLQDVLGNGRGDEVVAGIDCIVANEFEYISVEFIGSGLYLDIDVRSGITAWWRGYLGQITYPPDKL